MYLLKKKRRLFVDDFIVTVLCPKSEALFTRFLVGTFTVSGSSLKEPLEVTDTDLLEDIKYAILKLGSKDVWNRTEILDGTLYCQMVAAGEMNKKIEYI